MLLLAAGDAGLLCSSPTSGNDLYVEYVTDQVASQQQQLNLHELMEVEHDQEKNTHVCQPVNLVVVEGGGEEEEVLEVEELELLNIDDLNRRSSDHGVNIGDDTMREPLLRGLPDPSSVAKKRKIRRCKTAPAADISRKRHDWKDLSQYSKFMLDNLQPSFRLVVFSLVVYLGVGLVCFYAARDHIQGHKTNDILDALYFCIVTMTTVGYGDLVPNSVTAKLLACAFVFSGMAIVAIFVSNAADYLVDKQEALLVRTLHLNKNNGRAHLNRETEMNKVKHKLCMMAMFLLCLMLIGTAFLVRVEKLSIVDAFYCVCSTITTLGYGDKSFSTKTGRIFAVFWILISTVSLAQFLLYLAELRTEQKQQLLARYVLSRRMTFVDLEAADLDEDGAVSAAEFIVYKLKELGKISEQDIAIVMDEFEDLDVDHSGKISASDIINAQSTP
ncbi:hypothetical protein J5N97_028657 [Dioscorea zingiberensis]|uniref:EF-hand domain-containing protein n=1 Tax=Dioscorea zingiberensis TaxID=325984 RepID=A0A9D5BZK3_9LILI|nr:hypothetical protein J5N97_028657 [Dioscorea zingiberensis]